MSEHSHKECPFVECGSSDAFSWNTEGFGMCHSCGRAYPSKTEKIFDWALEVYPTATKYTLRESTEVPEEGTLEAPSSILLKEKTLEEKTKSDTISMKSFFKSIRSIPIDVVKLYEVSVEEDSEGNEVRHTYKYPHKDKYRYLPKDFSKNIGFTAEYLFGMDKFNAGSHKYITICEGELDTLAAYYMLDKRVPVVGLPSANVSQKLIKNCYSYLNSFDGIIVATDNDQAGDTAALKIANAFPGKVWRVHLSKYKDPCEFLENKATEEFKYAWANRKKYIKPGVFHGMQDFKTILSDVEINEYIPTPIDALNDTVKGLMRGHFTVITGDEGIGKTEILRLFEYEILKKFPDVPIGVLHMEESQKTCLLSLATYEMGVNLRDPDHGVSQDKIEAAIENLTKTDNLYLFRMGVDESPLEILDHIRYLSEACGCQYIFIDPIQQLAYGKDLDMTEEQVLSKISANLERIATEFNVGIITTAHVNDDGQTRSSRLIGKSASVRLDLTRDHMNPDPEIRNVTKISVSKNRPIGPTGYGGSLRFDPDKFTLAEYIDF